MVELFSSNRYFTLQPPRQDIKSPNGGQMLPKPGGYSREMSGTSARLGLKTFIDRNYLVQYTERYVEMEYMARQDLLGRS